MVAKPPIGHYSRGAQECFGPNYFFLGGVAPMKTDYASIGWIGEKSYQQDAG